MSIALLASAGKGAAPKLYPEDVFSTYLYTGNGSIQTSNNGIDLAGKGGMVWIKNRVNSSADHRIFDTNRGPYKYLIPSQTNVENSSTSSLRSFNSNGFTVWDDSETGANSATYASWTFRKAPKFFDIVTYTGDGTTNRVLNHSLGQEVGMIETKATSTTGDWNTYHRSAAGDLVLNTTAAQTASKTIIPSATTTTFTVNGVANTNGVTYVAYLYAHDPSADGIIQCGSFTTDGSGNATVNLGWEPQYLIRKSSSVAGSWEMSDVIRGMSVSNYSDSILYPNLTYAEATGNNIFNPESTGFTTQNGTANATYIYMAIRRPNKVPTSGSEVYKAIARTGTGAVATVSGVGFAPDVVIPIDKAAARTGGKGFYDRLRGSNLSIESNDTQAEYTRIQCINSFNNDGVTIGSDPDQRVNYLGTEYINYFFKRAKGFFDVVCYTGTGVARTVNHNLGVVPELMIVKSRSATTDWLVSCGILGTAELLLNYNSYAGQFANNNITSKTSSEFSVGTSTISNGSGATYIAYLFASLAGISKVGSYTGNGTSINLDMGFTTGARFFMVKRTDSTGDWYIFDTVRGIVSANDPHLSLNTTTAEVTTDDSVDPYSLGLTVNQVAATNINMSSASYIYLAIA